MARCPEITSIMRMVEDKFTSVEAEEILSHALVCRECAQTLLDAIEIQALENDEQLSQVTSGEAEKAFARISEITSGLAKTIAHPDASESSKPGIKSRLQDVFAGMAATAGVAGMGDFFAEMHHAPMFGENDKINFHDIERNTGISPSFTGKESDSHNVHSNGERNMPSIDNQIFQPAPTEFGLPGVDGKSANVAQHYADTCAIRSQQLVLRDFGINLSEDDLRKEAIDHGWYKPGGGTSGNDVGKLLEDHGVAVHRYEGANIFNLTNELAQGHKVIIGVNSGDLWHPGILNSFADTLGLQGADHALLVSGIDTSDPEHVKVILTDPGTGDIAKAYPMDQFIDAWKDSNCLMVSTDHPAPEWLNHPEMANFNYNLGHIPTVGALSYEQFHDAVKASDSYQHDPSAWDNFHSSFVGSLLGHIPAVSFLEDVGSRLGSIGHLESGDTQHPGHVPEEQHHPVSVPGSFNIGKGSWETPSNRVDEAHHPDHSREISTPTWEVPTHPGGEAIEHHPGYHHDFDHPETPESPHEVEDDHNHDDDHHH